MRIWGKWILLLRSRILPIEGDVVNGKIRAPFKMRRTATPGKKEMVYEVLKTIKSIIITLDNTGRKSIFLHIFKFSARAPENHGRVKRWNHLSRETYRDIWWMCSRVVMDHTGRIDTCAQEERSALITGEKWRLFPLNFPSLLPLCPGKNQFWGQILISENSFSKTLTQ